MPGHQFDASILREYDIRGIVGTTLSVRDAKAIGQAFGTLVAANGGHTVVIGQDGRLSSPSLANGLAKGLKAAGIDVLRIGIGPTPMLYFAAKHLGADGGIMVTGSHNPPDYNGFKMVMNSRSFFGSDIQKLGSIMRSGKFAQGRGRSIRRSVIGAYVRRLMRDAELTRSLSVVWDPGNGAACNVVESITRHLPGRHIVLNGEVDGTFPAHHPDPTLPETLEQLRATVLSEGCDLGIAFDGDGDRLGVVDNRGNILWGDQLMILWSEEILRRQPGSTIIADVKTSQTVFDAITRMGGKPIMWKTGHSLIKAHMAETGAVFAGEMSGHIFFADRYYGFDDALYAAVRLLNIVARSSRSLADMNDKLPKMLNTPELRIEVDESRKFRIIDEVKARLRASGADVNDIDGVRVSTPDGWWLLRASNTQNVLVGRCEAADADGLARLKALLSEQLVASGVPVEQVEQVMTPVPSRPRKSSGGHRVEAMA
ncbi:MAG TPA: phosphomannomutase/phosphoglucomutase [Ferrovibrio sp.]|jgi:phosphomannomutase|uniref:phosphoglucomutase/phosphomannomutase PgmG n=1 Tax=Ferrovibrio sp. TaxID=1917215 RepID=UPI002B4ADC6E|nr:phosphomannomutase/phosphoglucomutase [Ferrovibrio sp.]HLT79032.1 phosphomannomutase/phosphoglucomutase [Ferrovibrio sp.]